MKPKPKLTQERIVAVSLEMIDTLGEKSFSMRKLATALNVDPMAVYHHHASKSALMHAVMQAMMEECKVPAPSGNWQTDVQDLCHGVRRLAQRHPGAFVIYETYRHRLPAEHRLHEAFHETLVNAGFSRRVAVQSVRVLLAYTEAFSVDEILGWLDPGDLAELTESLNKGPYPVLIDLIDEIGCPDADADFDFGLTLLIQGLEAQIS